MTFYINRPPVCDSFAVTPTTGVAFSAALSPFFYSFSPFDPDETRVLGADVVPGVSSGPLIAVGRGPDRGSGADAREPRCPAHGRLLQQLSADRRRPRLGPLPSLFHRHRSGRSSAACRRSDAGAVAGLLRGSGQHQQGRHSDADDRHLQRHVHPRQSSTSTPSARSPPLPCRTLCSSTAHTLHSRSTWCRGCWPSRTTSGPACWRIS